MQAAKYTYTFPHTTRDETRTWAEEHLRIKKLGSSLYKAGVLPGTCRDTNMPSLPPCPQ